MRCSMVETMLCKNSYKSLCLCLCTLGYLGEHTGNETSHQCNSGTRFGLVRGIFRFGHCIHRFSLALNIGVAQHLHTGFSATDDCSSTSPLEAGPSRRIAGLVGSIAPTLASSPGRTDSLLLVICILRTRVQNNRALSNH